VHFHWKSGGFLEDFQGTCAFGTLWMRSFGALWEHSLYTQITYTQLNAIENAVVKNTKSFHFMKKRSKCTLFVCHLTISGESFSPDKR